MINPRKTAQPALQQKLHVIPVTSKPNTSHPSANLGIPILPFNPHQKFQNQNNLTSRMTTKTQRIPNNTIINRTLPSSRCTNNSTVGNSLIRQTTNQSHYTVTPENTKPTMYSAIRRDCTPCTSFVIPASKNFDFSELTQIQRANQELHSANLLYAQKLTEMKWLLNKVCPEKPRENVNPNIISESSDPLRKLESRSGVSMTLSNGYGNKEKAESEYIQYAPVMDEVYENSYYQETDRFKHLLQDSKFQTRKIETQLEKTKISKALLKKRVEGLEALVELLTHLNFERINEVKCAKQHGRFVPYESQNIEKIKALEQYKAKFDQLSKKSERMNENSRAYEEKLQHYKRKIQSLQNLLTKVNLELASRNQAINDLDETYRYNEQLLLKRLQMITHQMTSYYTSFNDDIEKIKKSYQSKEDSSKNSEISNKLLDLTAENNHLRRVILDLQNKLIKQNLHTSETYFIQGQSIQLIQQTTPTPKTPEKPRNRPQLTVVKQQPGDEPNISSRKQTEQSEPNGTQVNLQAVVSKQESSKSKNNKALIQQVFEFDQLRKQIQELRKYKLMYEQIKAKYLKLREQITNYFGGMEQRQRQRQTEEASHSEDGSKDSIPIPDECLKMKLYYEETIQGLHQRLREQLIQIQNLRLRCQQRQRNKVQSTENKGKDGETKDCCKQLANKYKQLTIRYSFDVNNLIQDKQTLEVKLSSALTENVNIKKRIQQKQKNTSISNQ